jgi:hypothetical protein
MRGSTVCGLALALGCNASDEPPSQIDAGSKPDLGDAGADAGRFCRGPVDVEIQVLDQSGAIVGQANVTLSAAALGEDLVGRTDAFGLVTLQVPAPGSYQVLAGKVVQVDPEVDYAFEEYVALDTIDVSCGDSPVEVRGTWACAAVAVDAFQLVVLDQATGDRICDARVVDELRPDEALTTDDVGDGCFYRGSEVGQRAIIIEAEGYTSQSLSVDIDSVGIYCSYPIGQTLSVELVPEN